MGYATVIAAISAAASVYSATRKPPKVKIPTPEPIAPAPTIDEAAKDRTESDRLRRRRGIRSNQLTGPLGAAIPTSATPAKTLTGQ